MATETPILNISLAAASDLSAKQYYAVTAASGNATLAGLGAEAIGILQNDPEAAEGATVMCLGKSKAKLGGTVAAGDPLGTDASGTLIVATWHPVVARAMAAGVSGDIISVMVVPAGKARPYRYITKHINLAAIADGDILTTLTPGFAGRLVSLHAEVTVAATTGSKLSTINLEIGTTNTTGGALALTSANMTPIGAVVEGTAITAANDFSATDTISIEAASTTTFGEGEIDLVIVLQ